MTLKKFGATPDGEAVWLAELKDGGISVEVISYGATVHKLLAPDRDGKYEDVILGKDNIKGYLDAGTPAASVIGRVANRISKHSFSLNGKRYNLVANEKKNTLHSASGNYARKNFSVIDATDKLVRMALRDCGEGGFPGEATIEVCYSLPGDGTLLMEYAVIPTMDTPVNLTNHIYFNLAGQGSGAVYGHTLSINADYFTPSDSRNIPTGEIFSVKKTPYDLRKPRNLGEALDELEKSGGIHNGFDINYVLKGDGWRKIAEAAEEGSGRVMEVFTDLPGVQLYAGNHIREGIAGKDGAKYRAHSGFCLETQFFPDSIHNPHFPGGIAFANELFTTATSYRFSAR